MHGLRATPLALVVATLWLLLLIVNAAPVWSSNSGPGGGEDRDRTERDGGGDRDREDSDRYRDERDSSGSDRDGDRDSSGHGGGDDRDVREDDDRSGSDDRDSSGHGSRDDSVGDEDRSGGDHDNSGKGNAESRDDNKTDTSGPQDGEARGALEREPFAVWRNQQGDRVRGGEVIFMSNRRDGAAKARAAGLRVLDEQRLGAVRLRVMRIAVPNGRSEDEVIGSLRAIDPAGTATFNHIYEPSGQVTPVLLAAPKPSHAKPTKARIGLVDAGVMATHKMLSRVKVTQRQFGEGAKHSAQHGTAVASRLADAAPGANIVAANVFTTMLDGQDVASAYAIARALDWLAREQVAVINLSLTGPANPVLEAITKRMIAKGHVLVAAVGNEGPRGDAQYPASYDKVIGVTAVDARNRVYMYANQGEAVDFAALGVDTPAASSSASVEAMSGTSYAAPIVTAAFARRVTRPNPKQAMAALAALKRQARDLGAPGRDPVFGNGLIDIPR